MKQFGILAMCLGLGFSVSSYGGDMTNPGSPNYQKNNGPNSNNVSPNSNNTVTPPTARRDAQPSPNSAPPSGPNGQRRDGGQYSSIMRNCAAQKRITLPPPGSGVKMTEDQTTLVMACIHKSKKAAFSDCSQQLGLAPGQRPTPTQVASIKSCIQAKGFHRNERKTANAN